MIRVRRRELHSALKALAPIIKGAGTLFVLQHVLFSLEEAPEGRQDGQRLTLSATDTEESAVVDVGLLEGSGGFQRGRLFLVPFGKLLAWVGADWSEEVEISLVEGRVHLKGGSQAKIATLGSEFPTLPELPDGWEETAPALGGEEIGEMQRAVRFSASEKIAKVHNDFITIYEEDGGLALFASWKGVGAWSRRLGVPDHPGLAGVAVRPSGVALLTGLAEGQEVRVVKLENHWGFIGSGFRLFLRRSAESFDPSYFLKRRVLDSDPVELPALSTLLPVIEGVGAMRAKRDKAGAEMRFEPLGEELTELTVVSDEATAAGSLPMAWPAFKCFEVELLCSMLVELDRVADREAPVLTIAPFGNGTGIRLEVPGRAMALLAGVR